MAEHNVLTDPELHEPKGVAAAAVGKVYKSDGAASGSWETLPSSTTSTQVLEAFSILTQNPSGTDVETQIEFGAGQGTGSDPVSLSSAGTVTFNEAGLYHIRVTTVYGRTGSAGQAELMSRAVYNGSQLGKAIHTVLSDAEIAIPLSVSYLATMSATDTLSFEILRDSGGNDSGGLFAFTPATSDWGVTPSAILTIDHLELV